MKEEFDCDIDLFKYFAGHSLGEYSALVCAGSLNFTDALYLLYERGKAMQEAVPVGMGSMIAVLGMKTSEINCLLESRTENDGVCEVANDNADGQVILSGNKESINIFQKILKEKKIKSIPLKVSAPFHCKLMKPAADSMKDKIIKTNFAEPKTKIYNNVTASPETNINIIKEFIIKQIYSTVKWRESIINMSNEGITNFVEIGPGKVLTGMVKRTIKGANCFSINTIADIKKFVDEFKK